MPIQSKIYSGGAVTLSVPAGATINTVKVNSTTATYTVSGADITITSPAAVSGDTLSVDYSQAPQGAPVLATPNLTGMIEVFANGKDIAADIASLKSMPMLSSGQPLGITRPVNRAGKKIKGFASTDGWTVTNGTEGVDMTTTNDYTGLDPTTGAVTGIPSRTGSRYMKKVQVLTNNTVGYKVTGVAAVVNGKVGFWVYFDSGANTNMGFTVGISTHATAHGQQDYAFNQNRIKRNGWNFLTVVRAADPVSNTDKEAHPYGLSEAIYDYTRTNFVTGTVQTLNLYVQNASGVTMYLDSVWGDWSVTPQFVLGADTIGTDVTDYMLTKFAQLGWKGYVCAPYLVNAGAWTDYVNWDTYPNAAGKACLDAAYAAGFDIINHSVNHQQIGGYTDPSQIRFEIEAASAWLDAMGYVRGQEFYASPQGSTSNLARVVIANSGMKIQRNGLHDAVHVTPFGVDDLSYCGSYDIGGNTFSYNGVDSTHFPYAYPHIANIRAWIDMMIKYQATALPFWHSIITLGDPGDGSGNSGSAVQMYKSTFDLTMDYLATKEAAGQCRIVDGMTGFYYGVGR